MYLSLIFLTVPLQADAAVSVMHQKAPVAIAATLTPEEMAFAARLSDADRHAFVEKMTPEQRREMIVLELQHRIREEQEMR